MNNAVVNTNKASKKVYTTGQVAKVCKVAPRTVSKWFDSGKLKGYRIPGSQDRRIPAANLLAFLQQHGMPTDAMGIELRMFGFCDAFYADRFTFDLLTVNLWDAARAVSKGIYTHAIVTDMYGADAMMKVIEALHENNAECKVAVVVDPSNSLESFKKWDGGSLKAYHHPCNLDDVFHYLNDE